MVSHSSLTLHFACSAPVDITGVGGLGKFAYGAGKRTRVGGGTYGRLTRGGGGPAGARPRRRYAGAGSPRPCGGALTRAPVRAGGGAGGPGARRGGCEWAGRGDGRAKISFYACQNTMACGPRGSAGGAHGTVHHLLLHCGG